VDSLVLRTGGLEAPRPTPVETNSDMVGGLELFRQMDYAKAEAVFHRLAEKTKDNPLMAEKARFYEAECLYLQHRYPKAADTYLKMLNDFASGMYREQACQRCFDIANYWLDDTRDQMRETIEQREGKRWIVAPRFLHWEDTKPVIDEQGRALEVLEQVRYNDINGPLADKALFLTGRVKLFNEDYRDADRCFSQLVEMHPNSSFAPQAIELAIFSKQMSTGGAEYDGRKVAEARDLVHKAQMNYPQLAQEKGEYLRNQLIGITMQQAEKDYKQAEFYRHTGKPCPAYFMYEVVRRRYPGTKYADLATERMHEIRGKAEKDSTSKLPTPPAAAPPDLSLPIPGTTLQAPPEVGKPSAPGAAPPQLLPGLDR
jgi:outer membrane protein assembly factor BamD (BamD/ComL family)